MSKEKLPYICSVCGTQWESASKRVPRHRCKGEFKGKVGTGIPAEGHPDYEPAKEEAKPIAGDIVFTTPDEASDYADESLRVNQGAMPIAVPKEEEEKPKKKTSVKEKKEEPVSPPTKGDESSSSRSLTPALMQTLNAIISGEELTKEQASVLSAQLVDGAVEIETSPVKAEITGLPLLMGIGVLTVALFWRAMRKPKVPEMPETQTRFDPNTEQW